MASVLRILDANANRAREALRVMEEAARFILDDAELAGGLKRLRHDLAAALAGVPGLEANRDTPGDVGTGIKTAREMRRESVADVAIAAGKRLSEALRAIEEYGKTLPANVSPQPPAPPGDSSSAAPRVDRSKNPPAEPGAEGSLSSLALPTAVESLRYRGYDLEARLNRALGTGRARQWRLCVLLTESLCPGGDWLRVAQAAIDGGADCLQLREKSLDAGELLRRARRLVALCRPREVSVIVNDRPDAALLAGADGVHLGQADLPCAEARRLVGGQLLIGVSTSRLEEAEAALRDGADYCGVGPMFATATKRKDVIAGPAYLRQYLAWGRLPHLAIGGITPGNVGELIAAGARGVAVSGAVCAAADPRAAAGAIVAALTMAGSR